MKIYDLGTLGLLAACKTSGNAAYLALVEKFLRAVFAGRLPDGRFNPLMRGGMLENGAPHREYVVGRQSYVCARSSCSSLIVLPKPAIDQRECLTVQGGNDVLRHQR